MDRRASVAAPLTQLPPQVRRKGGGGIRTWLVVSDSGKSHVEEVGKNPIMRRTGLPARDLRILDPVLSYPSTILGRERAIVVNLEHIKAVITATEVLVLNFKDPAVVPFVRDLQYKVSNCTFYWARFPHATDEQGRDHDHMEIISDNHNKEAIGESTKLSFSNNIEEDSQQLMDVPIKTDIDAGPSSKVLPFEFQALELCLESACRCLETETSTLEQEAYPALDELTSKISTLNLQHVRHLKSRLVALFGRVQKVRDELENLLDDDMDMAGMYLTDKLVHLHSHEIIASKDEISNNDAFSSHGDDESDDDDDNYDDLKSKNSSSTSGNRTSFKPKIQDLEMLLEAYFVQIEGTLNKLSTMREYVDDTEDYINIMLDDKQNQLLQMGVLISTEALLANAAIVVFGVFGINIHIKLFEPPAGEDPQHPSSVKFLKTVSGTIGSCLVLYFISIYFGKKRGLLE